MRWRVIALPESTCSAATGTGEAGILRGGDADGVCRFAGDRADEDDPSRFRVADDGFLAAGDRGDSGGDGDPGGVPDRRRRGRGNPTSDTI